MSPFWLLEFWNISEPLVMTTSFHIFFKPFFTYCTKVSYCRNHKVNGSGVAVTTRVCGGANHKNLLFRQVAFKPGRVNLSSELLFLSLSITVKQELTESSFILIQQ
jgi:hypothetical protein